MRKEYLIAIAGGALLFLLGLVIGISAGGPDTDEIEKAVADRIDAATAAEADRIGKIEESVAALGSRLDGIGGNVDAGTKAVGDVGAKLGDTLAGLGQSLGEAIETSKSASLAALESGLAGLRGQIDAVPPAAPAEEAPAPTAAAPEPGAAPSGISAGQTAVLSDGALRVFVTRVDDAAGSARLMANGTDLTLSVGQSQTLSGRAGECKVTLDALDRGHATVSGACGDALPAPAGAAPGSIVDLAEGLRVFVSGVTDAGARIAVNGVETRTVPLGKSMDVKVGDQACRVSVESIDRGRVALGYVCG